MSDYTISAQIESNDPTAEVAAQVGMSLAHLDPADYTVRGVSVWVVDQEPAPTPLVIVKLEEEITRLLALGIAVDQGHTLENLSPATPGTGSLAAAREKLEELRNAW